jgi:hypothetical protein
LGILGVPSPEEEEEGYGVTMPELERRETVCAGDAT